MTTAERDAALKAFLCLVKLEALVDVDVDVDIDVDVAERRGYSSPSALPRVVPDGRRLAERRRREQHLLLMILRPLTSARHPARTMSVPAVDARSSVPVMRDKTEKAWIRYPFWLGGAGSCTSACMLHPLDVGE